MVGSALVTALIGSDRPGGLNGLSLDALFFAESLVFEAPVASHVAIVAIDETTYRTPPFRDLPNALWTPDIARALDAVLEGGARVVGFDAIFPTSLERVLPGFEKPYLATLLKWGRQGRLVLGKTQHRDVPLSPFPGQIFAAGPGNVRSLNLYTDPDDVVRRLPTLFDIARPDGSSALEPSMSMELAARALASRPELEADGRLRLAGREIPRARDGTMLVRFRPGRGDIPTYSLGDLHACAEAGNRDYFAKAFADKVVMLGLVLDVEDRKLTPKRFTNGIGQHAPPAPCALQVAAEGPVRPTIPGVYIHAQAIEDLISGNLMRAPGSIANHAVIAAAALLAAIVTLALAPSLAALIVFGAFLPWTVGSVIAFHQGLALPLVPAMLAAAAMFFGLGGYRFIVIDRDRRQVKRAFSMYLTPPLVDQLLASGALPELGGERREISLMFTDLAGFSTLAEGLDPALLAEVLNEYFEIVNDCVMAHGGMVNEFMGDGALSFFGAPVALANHAARALAAARAIDARSEAFRAETERKRGIRLGVTRIGLHAGPVVVGNIGARQRLKYSALGDVVNTASRLEGLNKFFGTRICASDAIAKAAGDVMLRPLGEVVVKGRRQAMPVHEALPENTDAADLARYRAAFDLMQLGRGEEARAGFEALLERHPDDAVVAFQLRRLGEGTAQGAIVMTEK